MLNTILLYSGKMVDDGDINGGGGGFLVTLIVVISLLVYSAYSKPKNDEQRN